MNSGAKHGVPMWPIFRWDEGIRRDPFFTTIRAEYPAAEDTEKEGGIYGRTVNVSETRRQLFHEYTACFSNTEPLMLHPVGRGSSVPALKGEVC